MTLKDEIKTTRNAMLILAVFLIATIGIGAKLYFTTQHQIKVIQEYNESQQVLIDKLYGKNGG